MKNRIGLLLLVLISIGLGIGLVVTRKQAKEREREDAASISTLSNKWVNTMAALEEQRNTAAQLEKDLGAVRDNLLDLTNNYRRVSGDLSQVSANLAKTEATLKATEDEVKKREARILALEGQNQALDKQAIGLAAAMTNLTVQIAQTQQKLNAAEGDKAFLQKELKRLMAEKAELERQFNDLTILRAQVSRLKEELSIARRIEWIRQGIFADSKGAQRLMQSFNAPRPQPDSQVSDLNVEVTASGEVRVVPPPTNTPTATNPPSTTNQ